MLQDSELSTQSAVKYSICHPPCECHGCQTGFYAAEEHYQPEFSYCRRLSDDDAKGVVHSYVKQTKEARARLAGHLRSERLAS